MFGAYDVAEGWPKDIATLPGHQDWTWGAGQSVFAESPDRVLVLVRGELPNIDRPETVRLPQLGPSITFPINRLPWRDATTASLPASLDGPTRPQNSIRGELGVDVRWEHCVLVFDREGNLTEDWTQWDEMLRRPHAVYISPYEPEKHVWIVDDYRHAIFKFTNDGSELVQTIGEPNVPGDDENHFYRPTFMAWRSDGSFYVADGYANTRVVRFDADGNYMMEWGQEGNPPNETRPGYFNNVHGIAVDHATNRVFVNDRNNHRVQVFTEDGEYLDEWHFGAEPSNCMSPRSITEAHRSSCHARARIRSSWSASRSTRPGSDSCILIQYTSGMSSADRRIVRKGRGAASNPAGRFEPTRVDAVDDGWGSLEEPLPALETTVQPEAARRVIARNASPDIPFRQSINPYRGCEHGCVYCYARPSHAYVGLSPGLDFETRLFYKADAAERLRRELASKRYECSPIALGSNTDPYQPVEREYRVTRSILETLSACHHPATIVTKGAALIARDIDLLASMADRNLIAVHVSITTLDAALKRKLEPRAAAPAARLAAVRRLAEAGVPAGIMMAPVIPALTDHELERILDAAAEAGATTAGYVMLRLPHELGELFRDWLDVHEPLKAAHVMARVRALRGSRDNDPRFGTRQRGEGVYAQLFRKRFELACRRCGLNRAPRLRLDTSRFVPPAVGPQMGLL